MLRRCARDTTSKALPSNSSAAETTVYATLMHPNPAPPVVPPLGHSNRPVVPKLRPWLLFGCGGLLALALIIVATVGITLWWIQRPIKPVILTAAEKASVDKKLQRLGGPASDRPEGKPPRDSVPELTPEPIYVPGSRELRLTERELNGLLNLNTELGQTVRLELVRDAINAFLAVPIPQDFPIGGGKMFRARGRLLLSLGQDKKPFAVLEDVTVFGLSLPKAWLGGMKGENLIGDAFGKGEGSPALRGIKSLHVVPGSLVLEVEE